MSAKLWNFKIPYLIETRNDGGGGILPDVLGGGKFAKVYSGRKLIDSQPVHRVAIKVLHDRATCIAAVVAGAAAVAAYALPLKLNILVAIASAVAIGLVLDHTTSRRVEPEQDYT